MSDCINNYKYSPFRNIGPQQSYEEMDNNGKAQENSRRKLEGQKFQTKQGYDIEIVDYMTADNVIVKFLCSGYLKRTGMSAIKRGAVAYPFHKNKFGGYPGVGPYHENACKRYSQIWYGILERTNYEFSNNSKYRLYKNVSIDPIWLNFQNFAFWIDRYFSILNPDPSFNYQLDKDILQFDKEFKIYGPNTCCVVPRPLNSALECMQVVKTVNPDLPKGVRFHGFRKDGTPKYTASCSYGTNDTNGIYLGIFDDKIKAFEVYKKEKEKYLRSLADLYLSQNAIIPAVHQAIYNIDIKPYGI